MDSTAITATATAPAPAETTAFTSSLPPTEPGPRKAPKPWYERALLAAASLRVTVVLFALSIVLVFFGTLAQVYLGTHSAVTVYFRCALVWVPLQIFFPKSVEVAGSFPYPRGWLLGGLLLANLLAAHTVRFQVSWKRAGILFIHSGLIVMMLSELITGLAAVEGHMTIVEGARSNYVEDHHRWEVAFIRAANAENDEVVVLPDSFLRDGGVSGQKLLPCDVELVGGYMVNSYLPKEPPADAPNPATAGESRKRVAIEKPPVTGTETGGKVDIPSAYVELKDKRTGARLGVFLLSGHLQPQTVVIDGVKYQVSLRPRRTYKPYSITLLEARRDDYLGTNKAKNFSSKIILVDSELGEKREVLISMNSPLRY